MKKTLLSIVIILILGALGWLGYQLKVSNQNQQVMINEEASTTLQIIKYLNTSIAEGILPSIPYLQSHIGSSTSQ